MLGKLAIDVYEVPLVIGNFMVAYDGAQWALWDADRTIYTLVGIDDQEIGAFHKTIHGADRDTIGVLALYASFGHYVCHFKFY